MIHKCFWLYSRGPEFGCFSFWKRQNDTQKISYKPTCRWESLCPASWSYEAREAWWSNFVTWGLNGFNQWLNQPSFKLEGGWLYDVWPFLHHKENENNLEAGGPWGKAATVVCGCGVIRYRWQNNWALVAWIVIFTNVVFVLVLVMIEKNIFQKNLLATVEQGGCEGSWKSLSQKE